MGTQASITMVSCSDFSTFSILYSLELPFINGSPSKNQNIVIDFQQCQTKPNLTEPNWITLDWIELKWTKTDMKQLNVPWFIEFSNNSTCTNDLFRTFHNGTQSALPKKHNQIIVVYILMSMHKHIFSGSVIEDSKFRFRRLLFIRFPPENHKTHEHSFQCERVLHVLIFGHCGRPP